MILGQAFVKRSVTRAIRPETLALLVAILLATAFNIPFWDRMLGIVGPPDPVAIGALVRTFVLVSGFFYVALLLVAWPFVFRPLVTVLLLISSAVTYFMHQYGIVIDLNMIRNVVETDSAEVQDLITSR